MKNPFPRQVKRIGVAAPASSADRSRFASSGAWLRERGIELVEGEHLFSGAALPYLSASDDDRAEDLNRLKGGKKGEDVREKVYAFGDGFNDSVTNMLSEVYEDIERGGRAPGHRYATFADGVRNAEICNAIYRSAHNNSSWEVING